MMGEYGDQKENALLPEMGRFFSASLLPDPNYAPGQLLNAVMDKLHLQNDVALSRALEVDSPS